jgi:hypothetical protein
VLQCFFRRADDHDVEVLGPVTTRRLRHHVPVIERLQVHQPGLVAGGVHQPAAGIARERHPGLELRIDRIGIIAIVEHLVMKVAARDHQMVESTTCERGVGTLHQHGEMIGIQDAKVGVHGMEGR